MPITIRPYAQSDEPHVADFNRRLREHDVTFQFPESCVPSWLPAKDDRRIYQQFFLAVEDDAIVRGGYILKHQDFVVDGQIRSIGNYQLPLSEGIIDRKYSALALRFVNDALKKQPLLYALGMGGLDRPLPRLLSSMGWRLQPVPFHFRVCHPSRFFRNIEVLRTSFARKVAFDIAAATGLGWLSVKLMQRSGKYTAPPSISAKAFTRFESWTDDLWESVSSSMTFSAVRDSDTLNILYPEDDARFKRLVLIEDGREAGWVIMLATPMSGHKQFGNMRVGTIVDCLCTDGREEALVRHAVDYLEKAGVDLIVTNQTHPACFDALKTCGFLNGPSNFILATSPGLTRLLKLDDEHEPVMHINRGDGDGPIHL